MRDSGRTGCVLDALRLLEHLADDAGENLLLALRQSSVAGPVAQRIGDTSPSRGTPVVVEVIPGRLPAISVQPLQDCVRRRQGAQGVVEGLHDAVRDLRR